MVRSQAEVRILIGLFKEPTRNKHSVLAVFRIQLHEDVMIQLKEET